jgi:hypothetical protein
MPSGSQTCSTEPGSVRAARRDSLASQQEQELEDAEHKAALADWRPREAAGQVHLGGQAIDQAAGFLRDDPDEVREMLGAVALLADEPRPTSQQNSP